METNSCNAAGVNPKSLKRALPDTITYANTGISIDSKESTASAYSYTSSIDSSTNSSHSANRKRPRLSSNEPNTTTEERYVDDFSLPSTSEDDAGSVDSILDAVDTILRDDDDDHVDTMESIQSRLPLPDAANDDPDDYLLMLLHAMFPQIKVRVKSSNELNDYFPTPTEEQMSNYTTQVVNVVRLNDAQQMKEYYQTHGRASLDCCNRFGEGLLNMACRRGFTETVKYLLLSPEIQLNVRVRDDGGRTPLHDACWYPEPQLDVCAWIMQQDPSLFLVADKRGYTPFQYARKSDWLVWRKFLYSNYQAWYSFATQPHVVETFSCPER